MAEPAPAAGMSLNDLLNAQLDEAAQSQPGRHLTPSRPTGSDRSSRSSSAPRHEASETRTRALPPPAPPSRSRVLLPVLLLALVALGLTPFLWPRLTRSPLQVSSDPVGAAVYWNDELVGRTPLTTRVKEPLGLLRLEKKGFVVSERQVDLAAESAVTLTLAPEPLSILFQSTPPGAAVRIDGGAAFPAGTPALLLPDSEHTISMTLPGFKPLTERHRFASGETLFARLLEPLPAPAANAAEPAPAGGLPAPSAEPGKARATAPAAAPGRFTFRFVDKPYVGTLRIDGGPAIELNRIGQVVEVPPGARTLTIQNERDAKSDTWRGEVTAGQEVQVSIDWK